MALSRPGTAKRRVEKSLADAHPAPAIDPDLIGVAAPEAASVSAIREGLATGPGFHGIRLRNNTVGGVVVPAAYVYRAN
ncbi:MAG: hypothetical protein ACRELC_13475 [Gemmatimonadota bacterium]